MFALRRAVTARPAQLVRSLHSSSSVAKKAKPTQEIEEFEMEDDLFAGVEAAEPTSTGRAARREQYANDVLAKKVGRVGVLRKVVSLSDNDTDLEGLDAVLRAWRVSGQRVTKQTATELVGRCIKLGRPDLAKKYVSDRLSYGVPPLPENIEAKLQNALKA